MFIMYMATLMADEKQENIAGNLMFIIRLNDSRQQ